MQNVSGQVLVVQSDAMRHKRVHVLADHIWADIYHDEKTHSSRIYLLHGSHIQMGGFICL